MQDVLQKEAPPCSSTSGTPVPGCSRSTLAAWPLVGVRLDDDALVEEGTSKKGKLIGLGATM